MPSSNLIFNQLDSSYTSWSNFLWYEAGADQKQSRTFEINSRCLYAKMQAVLKSNWSRCCIKSLVYSLWKIIFNQILGCKAFISDDTAWFLICIGLVSQGLWARQPPLNDGSRRPTKFPGTGRYPASHVKLDRGVSLDTHKQLHSTCD